MANNVIFGAIRWDAWYANANSSTSSPSFQTAAILSNTKYRGRAPVHMATSDPLTLKPSISQSIIDNEINVAAAANIKYWAYLLYATANSGYSLPDLNYDMNLPLVYHRQSTIKNKVNWAAMAPSSAMGSTGNYANAVSLYTSFMQDSNYQKVLGNRPLLYIYWSEGDITSRWGGNTANFKACIDSLRTSAQTAGLGNPYIVVMSAANTVPYTAIGGDAISLYAYSSLSGAVPLNPTYSSLDLSVRNYWNTLANTGVPIVPITMSGWNTRPRRERIPSWESSARPYIGTYNCFQNPTNTELATHVQAAVDYVVANPSICPSSAILHYAWNECDEGGAALTPTIEDPTGARALALKPALT